ncbi:MAG: hypothetical protein FWC71_08105 [Defluviitaleaceae bacterium]|nr:hypothetical protein [Defluviitaleaceae bacterium]
MQPYNERRQTWKLALRPLARIILFALLLSFCRMLWGASFPQHSALGIICVQAADALPSVYAPVRAVTEKVGLDVIITHRNYFVRTDDGSVLHFIAGRGYAVHFYADRTRRIIPFADGATPIWHDGNLYMYAHALADIFDWVYITPRFHPINITAEARFLYNQAIVALRGDDYIFGQNVPPLRGMRVGTRGDLARHGCGPVAVYNALLHLHQNHPEQQTAAPCIAYIIRYLDYNGGINLGGLAGTHPEVLTAYLQRSGHNAELILAPTGLDTHVRDAVVTILLYGQVRGGAFVHYVKIRYDAGRFWVYNEFGNDTHPRVYDSLDAWVAERRYRVVALVTITNTTDATRGYR